MLAVVVVLVVAVVVVLEALVLVVVAVASVVVMMKGRHLLVAFVIPNNTIGIGCWTLEVSGFGAHGIRV